ncbi:MAG: CDP-diacylglycerol--serine O-phosphatidyltransferase [Syntrophomonadaceae bacterium]|nr:CDP-diacylglycerol--serine O-phosphatidyltransferase [Syntrophomonadaceae bacterium]
MLDLMSSMIANLVTIMNIIFGTLSLVCTVSGDYKTAALLVLIAVILDGMDGRIARKFDSVSAFGKELDSLSDLVSFGVAPAILIFSQVLQAHYHILGGIIILAYVVCGALRLARFNIMNVSDYFLGMPITIAGLLMAVISLLSYALHPMIIMVSVLALAGLMISKIKIAKL